MSTMTPSMPASLPASRQTPPPMKPAMPKTTVPVATPYVAYVAPPTVYRKFTVDEYHKLLTLEVIGEEERIELIEGSLVLTIPPHSPHSSTVMRLATLFISLKLQGWATRTENPVTLSASEPAPDAMIVRGDLHSFDQRQPVASEVGLILEVADSSLSYDRTTKNRIYALESIPEYWIVNLVERQVEVYTDPTGPANDPIYRIRKDFAPRMSVPLMLDGAMIAHVPVDDLLPTASPQ